MSKYNCIFISAKQHKARILRQIMQLILGRGRAKIIPSFQGFHFPKPLIVQSVSSEAPCLSSPYTDNLFLPRVTAAMCSHKVAIKLILEAKFASFSLRSCYKSTLHGSWREINFKMLFQIDHRTLEKKIVMTAFW